MVRAIACACITFGATAFAQDPVAPPRLEELIPDSAVANPEAWADAGDVAPSAEDVDGEVAGGNDGGDDDGAPDIALEPDSPMADMPALTVEWPDDLQLPPLERVEPDDDIRFAETPDFDLGEQTATREVRISDELVLAFPANEDSFPLLDEFVERFEELSTIEELSGGEDNIAQLAARARSDEELLVEILRVYGYYGGQVIRTVGGVRPGDEVASSTDPAVRFDILPGPRYRFADIDLGNLASAPDAVRLRETFEIDNGDPISSDKIVEEQFDLDRELGETGYPFAEIDEPNLLIDHRETSGDLAMPVDPNGKYVFGDVVSSLPDFLSGEHLATIARFDPGDVYKRSLELDLRRAITATGLVSSVTISPRETAAPTASDPGTVALDVEITKAPLRTITGAIGYGSEEGFRLQGSWEHRNLFPSEGSLKLRGIIGTQEQLAGVTFRKNNFGGRDRVLTLDAYASTLDSDAFDARTVAVVGTYERTSTLLFQKPLSWGIGLEIIATQERPQPVFGNPQPRQTFFVAAIPGNILLDTTDSLLDPTEGFRLGGRLSPEASRTNGVESFYVRSQVDASYYQSVTDKVVMAGRVRLGTIPGVDLTDIAPSRRYYAGGGGSVRGYGFQQIGPRDAAGQPSGGRSVVEAAVEARIATKYFDGALSVVPFVDIGSVSTGPTPDFDEVRIGAGLGVRYKTGFGPIRVDVGVPVNPGPDDSPVAVYVSLGQAF